MTAKWLFKLVPVELQPSGGSSPLAADPSTRPNGARRDAPAKSGAARRAEAKRVQSFARRGRGR